MDIMQCIPIQFTSPPILPQNFAQSYLRQKPVREILYTQTHTYKHTYTHAQTHTYTNIHIHTHIYTYRHTHTYTRTHILHTFYPVSM
ncbi:hypothetical protein LOAG_01009 [Loa loa]|uniref:Uncharacterized protein n=1 Tax=Loa loa TaxID=7209 RepID=A0A1S0U9W7_LOALO|nr:hypothetical protein LOAG_01009 [Loa loa]EFO27478.1 hypothetical protein LOAG_01009 [Loa loa]